MHQSLAICERQQSLIKKLFGKYWTISVVYLGHAFFFWGGGLCRAHDIFFQNKNLRVLNIPSHSKIFPLYTRFHAKRVFELSPFVQRGRYSRSPLRCWHWTVMTLYRIRWLSFLTFRMPRKTKLRVSSKCPILLQIWMINACCVLLDVCD